MDISWGNAVAGLLVGVMVGATGVGGGSLMTPVLVLLLGVAPHTAVGTDLLYASVTKLFGVSVHSLKRRVDWNIVGKLALGSLPTAVVTLIWLQSQGRDQMKDGPLLTALAITLVVTSVAMLALPWIIRRSVDKPRKQRGVGAWLRPAATVAVGALLGFLVTMTSIGAGALGVVMLVLLYPTRLPPVRLVATDLAHAIPLAMVAGAGHLLLGHVDFSLLGQLLLGSIPGVWIGAHFGGRLPDRVLRVAIALVLALVGIRMLV
jgi:uncharacterized membrane protein YfcA